MNNKITFITELLNSKKSINLSELLEICYNVFNFDYVTIIDFACRTSDIEDSVCSACDDTCLNMSKKITRRHSFPNAKKKHTSSNTKRRHSSPNKKRHSSSPICTNCSMSLIEIKKGSEIMNKYKHKNIGGRTKNQKRRSILNK